MNAGSSSLKLALVTQGAVVETADLTADRADSEEELDDALGNWGGVDAVAHRIVHGGTRLRHSVRVDARVLEGLRAAAELAPLHARRALGPLERLLKIRPSVPQVACLDSAFHNTLPLEASLYPVPYAWRRRFGLRRLGFHGFSHSYASRRAAELLTRPAHELRVVTCHLGAGASLAAIREGRSIDTTMGFTPNEGLVMATRSGSVDPGALLWVINRGGITTAEAENALEHEAGLQGLAGTADMRVVLDRAAEGESTAQQALAVYLHRLRAGIASMVAAMGGLDALVFTGGVGERSPEVRAGACEGLGFLGVALDPALNEPTPDDAVISRADSAVGVLRVTAREDLELAAEAARVLSTET